MNDTSRLPRAQLTSALRGDTLRLAMIGRRRGFACELRQIQLK